MSKGALLKQHWIGYPGRQYLKVALYRDGKSKHISVHRLVMRAFVGAPPEGMEVRHGPGGRADNRLANLSYGTHVENVRDRWRDGTSPVGEGNSRAICTEADVREIRRRYAAGGVTHRLLAREYGVANSTIRAIITGQNWKHVA